MQAECNVSASQGAITPVAEVFSQETNRALGKIFMPQGAPVTYSPRDALVPLRSLRGINEIDAILRPVVKAGRKEVHAAIEKVLKGWPGRRRGELWARLRRLRNEGRETGLRHAVWNEGDVDILRANYAQGRAGARRAVKELLARHPDWSARLIWEKATKLGISTRSAKPRPWSREEQGVLLWNAGEKPVGRIARKLGRTKAAVHQMLSNRGSSAKLRTPKEYTLHRVSRLLGVSDTIVRQWFQKGLFGEAASRGGKRGRSKSAACVSAVELARFCENHPDKVDTQRCDPLVVLWIEENNEKPPGWHGVRQHLIQRRPCPNCGRIFRGNGYFRHVNRCAASPASDSKPQVKSVAIT